MSTTNSTTKGYAAPFPYPVYHGDGTRPNLSFYRKLKWASAISFYRTYGSESHRLWLVTGHGAEVWEFNPKQLTARLWYAFKAGSRNNSVRLYSTWGNNGNLRNYGDIEDMRKEWNSLTAKFRHSSTTPPAWWKGHGVWDWYDKTQFTEAREPNS